MRSYFVERAQKFVSIVQLIIVLAILLVVNASTAEDEYFSCSKSENSCYAGSKNFYTGNKKVLKTFHIGDKTRAAAVETAERGTRVVLRTNGGSADIFNGGKSKDEAEKTANEINSYFDSGRASYESINSYQHSRIIAWVFSLAILSFVFPAILKFKSRERWQGGTDYGRVVGNALPLIPFFIVISIFHFVAANDNYFVCYRSKNYCSIGEKNVYTGKVKIKKEFPLNYLYGTRIDSKNSKDSEGNSSTSYSLVLETRYGNFQTLNNAGRNDVFNHADKINNYLKSKEEKILLKDSQLFMRLFIWLFTIIITAAFITKFRTKESYEPAEETAPVEETAPAEATMPVHRRKTAVINTSGKASPLVALIVFVAIICCGFFVFGQKDLYVKVSNSKKGLQTRPAESFEGTSFECSRVKNLCSAKETQSGKVLKAINLSEIELAKAIDQLEIEKMRLEMDDYIRRLFDKQLIIIPSEVAGIGLSSSGKNRYSVLLLTKDKKMYVLFANQGASFVRKHEAAINSYLQSSQEKLEIKNIEKVPGLKLAGAILALVGIIGLLRTLGIIRIEKEMTYNDIVMSTIAAFFGTVFYCFMSLGAEGFAKILLTVFCSGMCLVSFSALFGKLKTVEEMSPEEQAKYSKACDNLTQKLTGMSYDEYMARYGNKR